VAFREPVFLISAILSKCGAGSRRYSGDIASGVGDIAVTLRLENVISHHVMSSRPKFFRIRGENIDSDKGKVNKKYKHWDKK